MHRHHSRDVIGYERERIRAIHNRLNSPTDYIKYQMLSAQPLFETIRQFVQPKGLRVLEVGCGTGGISLYLASQGMNVFAIDRQQYDSQALAAAREFATSHSITVHIELADAVALPFTDASFDCIVCSSVIEHLHDPSASMMEMHRVLKPGGLVFLDFPLFRGPYGGHIDDLVKIPWFHMLPTDTVKRRLYKRNGEREYKVYLTLNRMTHCQFRQIIRGCGFTILQFRRMYYLTHPGRKLVRSLGEAIRHKSARFVLRSLHDIASDFTFKEALQFVFLAGLVPLSLVPGIGELFTSGEKYVLQKKEVNSSGCF